jgi:hypothetical protein
MAKSRLFFPAVGHLGSMTTLRPFERAVDILREPIAGHGTDGMSLNWWQVPDKPAQSAESDVHSAGSYSTGGPIMNSGWM